MVGWHEYAVRPSLVGSTCLSWHSLDWTRTPYLTLIHLLVQRRQASTSNFIYCQIWHSKVRLTDNFLSPLSPTYFYLFPPLLKFDLLIKFWQTTPSVLLSGKQYLQQCWGWKQTEMAKPRGHSEEETANTRGHGMTSDDFWGIWSEWFWPAS